MGLSTHFDDTRAFVSKTCKVFRLLNAPDIEAYHVAYLAILEAIGVPDFYFLWSMLRRECNEVRGQRGHRGTLLQSAEPGAIQRVPRLV